MTETKKAEKTARKDMRLSVRNFGPIAEAEIDLRPLTIFAGPSNTGKSYLAILLYSLFQKNRLIRHRYSGFRSVFRHGDEDGVPHVMSSDLFEFKLTEKEIGEAANIMKNDVKNMSSEEEPCFSEFSSEVKEWVKERMVDIFKAIAAEKKENLCRCMGELSLEGEGNFLEELKVVIHDDSNTWSLSGENTSINIDDIDFDLNASLVRMLGRNQAMKAVAEKEPEGSYDSRAWFFLLDEILNKAVCEVLKNINSPASYLPAARTGVMQSHQAITGGVVHRAAFADGFRIPSLSGILADFLQTIIQISGGDAGATIQISGGDTGATRIRSIANDIEKDILKGKILVDTSAGHPRFSYKQKKVEMSLRRSSSMVSELASVVLFLRNCVEEGNVLIIEEPEAHLHPAAQMKIASIIAKLVRANVKVVITTHSHYILERLSNYMRVEGLSEEARKATIGDEHLYLKEEEVGCYRFKSAPEGTVVEVPFDKESGILFHDHEDIDADIHNESVGILNKISL